MSYFYIQLIIHTYNIVMIKLLKKSSLTLFIQFNPVNKYLANLGD